MDRGRFGGPVPNWEKHMSTVFMKLTGAIVVGGEVVKPPAIVEVSSAEGADLARRGKAVPATEADEVVTAVTPSAEVAKADAGAFAGATETAPVAAQVVLADAVVDVSVIGQATDGSPVVDDASAAAIVAAPAADLVAALQAAEAEVANVAGKTAKQKKADLAAVEDARAALAAAESATTTNAE